jgi:hypothetical protein
MNGRDEINVNDEELTIQLNCEISTQCDSIGEKRRSNSCA